MTLQQITSVVSGTLMQPLCTWHPHPPSIFTACTSFKTGLPEDSKKWRWWFNAPMEEWSILVLLENKRQSAHYSRRVHRGCDVKGKMPDLTRNSILPFSNTKKNLQKPPPNPISNSISLQELNCNHIILIKNPPNPWLSIRVGNRWGRWTPKIYQPHIFYQPIYWFNQHHTPACSENNRRCTI